MQTPKMPLWDTNFSICGSNSCKAHTLNVLMERTSLFMIIKDFLNSSKSGTPLEKKNTNCPILWFLGYFLHICCVDMHALDGQYALKDYGFTKTNGQYK